MGDFVFAYPWMFILIIPLAFLLFRSIFGRSSQHKTLDFSDLSLWGRGKDVSHPTFHEYIRPLLKAMALLFLVMAAARPQSIERLVRKSNDGLDIVLTLDTSQSMSEGLPYGGRMVTRLDAAKSVVAEFVKQRSLDRIGLVVFGQEAFTQAPLTLDHEVLEKFIDSIYINMAGRGTSIGPAIATSVKRLKGLEVKSKIVILLTDGQDSGRDIDPISAAKAAQVLGVKIYTVGLGSAPQGGLLGSMFGRSRGSDLDENTLTQIAESTGGRYFRADSVEALSQVYATIDELEKSKVEVKDFSRQHEEGAWFVLLALAFFLAEILLGLTPWRIVE